MLHMYVAWIDRSMKREIYTLRYTLHCTTRHDTTLHVVSILLLCSIERYTLPNRNLTIDKQDVHSVHSVFYMLC